MHYLISFYILKFTKANPDKGTETITTINLFISLVAELFTKANPDKGTETMLGMDELSEDDKLSLQKLTPIRGRKQLHHWHLTESQAGLQKLTPIRGRKLIANA